MSFSRQSIHPVLTTSGSFPLSVVFLAVSVSVSVDCESSVLCLRELEWFFFFFFASTN